MTPLPSAFLPLAPSTAVAKEIARYCVAITSEAPPRTNIDSKAQLERMLMRVLHTAGLRGVGTVIRHANIPGLTAAAADDRPADIPGRRYWTSTDRERHAELRITVYSSRQFKMVSVIWAALPREPKTPRARARHRLQQQFYARYMAAGQRAYATPPRRISAADRQILLVGEFEADWNNGGFNQYLFNKGRRRAAAALRALENIGAIKTAELLRQALSAADDETALQKLDDKYDRTGEDLALLGIKANP